MAAVHEKLSEQLVVYIEAMKKYYDKQRKDNEPFKPWELVMLNGKNIRAKHRCKKWEDKMYGPFKVLSTGKNETYCTISLRDSWKIHLTFDIALLERYRGSDPRKQVVEIEADDAGWEMVSIIASGPSDEDAKKHAYLVKWEGYLLDEKTWEIYENIWKVQWIC